MRRHISWVLLFVVLCFCIAQGDDCQAGFRFTSKYKIELSGEHKVLGSLRGNYLIQSKSSAKLVSLEGVPLFSKPIDGQIRPILSSNGQYFGLVHYATGGEARVEKIEFFDTAGKIVWTFNKPEPRAFAIANNGYLFGIDDVKQGTAKRIHLFDQFGMLLNIINCPTYAGLETAPSGNRFLIAMPGRGLAVYDTTGTERMVLPWADVYTFDNEELYVGTWQDGAFHLFQEDREVKTIPLRNREISHMVLSVAKDRVILMGPKYLGVFALISGNMLWETMLEEKERKFVSLDMSKNGRFIACGVDNDRGEGVPAEKRHQDSFIYLFSADGKILTPRQVFYSRWAAGFPRVVFSPSGGSITLQTGDKIEKLAIR